MFLHIIRYDRKFIADVYRHFERVSPGKHVYLVFGRRRPEAQELFPYVAGFVSTADDVRRLVSPRMQAPRGILIHGLLRSALPLLGVFPMASVAWYVWGTEFYNEWPKALRRLYMPATTKLINRLSPVWRRAAKDRLVAVLGRNRQLAAASNRVDICVSFGVAEFNRIKQSGLLKRAMFFRDAVRALEDIVDIKKEVKPGRHIQLGNSSCPNNNHLEMIQQLSRMQLGDRKVVCPLSYGNPIYANEVCRFGQRVLGPAFHPLMDFVSLEVYQSLIGECGIVIMNHLRQQALGNIIDGVWRGSKVFLNNTSVYETFRDAGIRVALIQDFVGNPQDGFSQLAEPEIGRNREMLAELYSAASLTSQTRAVLDCLDRVTG